MNTAHGPIPICVRADRRYFETIDGQPFLMVGLNDAISWPGLEGLYRRRDLPAVEAYLRGLADHGINTLRLMLEYAHFDDWYFEDSPGHFNPVMVQLWDDLLALCGSLNLRVLLTPWDTFWMARRWDQHPYSAARGGPAASPAAFFTDDAVIAAAIRRFQFVIERWGGSGVIAAWDLFNEIDPYWGGTPQQQYAVITRLSGAIRDCERSTWGFTRPQTVSCFGPDPAAELEPLIFGHPALDFATTHVYSKGVIDCPAETVSAALAMSRWVQHGVTKTGCSRPFTDSEHGPIHLFNDLERNLDEPFDDEYERHIIWAHLASGGAGSGMRWPARHPHVLTPGMKRSLRSLSAFTQWINWTDFDPVNVPRVAIATDQVHLMACADHRQAVIWLLRTIPPDHHGAMPERPPLREVSLRLGDLEPGQYDVIAWDTAAGHILSARISEVARDGILTTPIDAIRSDLALAVRRR